MCGICGIYNFKKEEKVEKDDLEIMVNTLAHRGPDDSGVFIDNNIGLGHRRLSIIDLSDAGHQPMFYEDLIIVFNGEIYNFQEEREKLIQEGYKFKSRTDTEVILALYKKYGKNCLNHLRGMFALAIWDEKNKTLFCARDRFGKKPFKYYFDGENFIFASELKAILSLKKIKREIDWEAIDDYLILQYVPHPKTGFKNIFKLPQANYLEIKNNKIKIERYWDLNYSNKLDLTEQEWCEKLENKFDESVKLRMISDVPLGAFLSGGVDSSAIVAFMSKYADRVKTFSIGFKEKKYNELNFAGIVAKKYNTDHHELIIEPKNISLIKKLVYQYEEPYADPSQLSTFLLAEFAKKYVTVALNGDGGDENFGGYDKYEKHLIAKYLQILPFKNQLAKVVKFIDKNIYSSFLLYKTNLFLKTLNQKVWQRHLNYTHYFDTYARENFYTDDFKEKLKKHSTFKFFKELMKNKTNLEYLDQIFYLDFNSYVPDNLMVKVDIATMANSLESRSPLLDHEFVELVAKIPRNLKIRKIRKERKYIFKKMLKKYLPNKILYRKKMGFGLPIDDWFRNDLKNYIEENILASNSLSRKIMKGDKLKELLNDHFDKRRDNSKKLWALMVLNLWHREFF